MRKTNPFNSQQKCNQISNFAKIQGFDIYYSLQLHNTHLSCINVIIVSVMKLLFKQTFHFLQLYL